MGIQKESWDACEEGAKQGQTFWEMIPTKKGKAFAPVSKLLSIFLLLSHAHCRKLVAYLVDIKNVFRNGHLGKEINLKKPGGFVDICRPNHLWERLRTLYGPKEAAQRFYNTLLSTLSLFNLHYLRTDAIIINVFCTYLHPLRTYSAVLHGKIEDEDVWVVSYLNDLLKVRSDSGTVEICKR